MNQTAEAQPPFTPSALPFPPQPVPHPTSADSITTIDSSTTLKAKKPLTGSDSHHPSRPRPWSTGLCDCFLDVHTCCLTFWCPCVAFGRIAEIVDRGSPSCGMSGALYALMMCVTGCSSMYSCFYRSKLRGQYFLRESPCADCCIHCCCQHCALCQEYRQLKSHGFDLSIGWHGNMERQRRLQTVAPVVNGGMLR